MRVDVSNLFWNRSKERISAIEIPYLLSKIVQFVGSSRIPRPVSLLQLQPLHGVCREGIFRDIGIAQTFVCDKATRPCVVSLALVSLTCTVLY
jgi:hypothetical protein